MRPRTGETCTHKATPVAFSILYLSARTGLSGRGEKCFALMVAGRFWGWGVSISIHISPRWGEAYNLIPVFYQQIIFILNIMGILFECISFPCNLRDLLTRTGF